MTKVVEAFQFCSELDILELRLNTLKDLVDFTIISESPVAFSGLQKPLWFDEHKHEKRFKKFEHKIIHQIVLDTPDEYTNLPSITPIDKIQGQIIDRVQVGIGDWWPASHPPYGRDTWQKESLLRPMQNLQPDDIVILSDADEVINPDALKRVLDNFDPTQIFSFYQKLYYYYFDCLKVEGLYTRWPGPMLCTYENFLKYPMCLLKMKRRGVAIEDGGWHFSYMAANESIQEKMNYQEETYMYTDKNKKSIVENTRNRFRVDHDMFFIPCKFKYTPIDETYPGYLVENQDKFKDYIGGPV